MEWAEKPETANFCNRFQSEMQFFFSPENSLFSWVTHSSIHPFILHTCLLCVCPVLRREGVKVEAEISIFSTKDVFCTKKVSVFVSSLVNLSQLGLSLTT